MNINKNLVAPIALLFISIAIAIYFRPLMIIDETRYISVAWEMYSSGNYLVPHLNGLPYDHKPPLLFWIIVSIWNIFGVNETIVRFIPFIFSAGTLYLGYKIYNLLWSSDKEGLNIFPWVMAGVVIFTFYSTLLMFDIMLSFWVALAIYSGIKAVLDDKLSSYILLALAVAFGILAKSPVVLVHLFPLYIFASFWSPKKVKFSFYLKGLLAVVAGILIALIWAIPAALEGGDAFAYGIFWGQYAGRAVNAFAHKRAFWWYIPWIPIIMMPWILYRGFYRGFFKLKVDSGLKVLLVWIVGDLIIFSLISGKQIAYIAPEFLAFALLITRALSLSIDKLYRPYLISFIYLIFGIALVVAPWFIKGYIRVFLDTKAFIISGIILIIYALYLALKKFTSYKEIIASISVGTMLLIFAIHYSINLYLKSQDLTNFSKVIATLQNRGITVAHFGKYHNQYQFVGRLKKPLKVIKSEQELKEYLDSNPNGAIITYRAKEIKVNKDAIFATTKFRTKNALLVKAKEWRALEE